MKMRSRWFVAVLLLFIAAIAGVMASRGVARQQDPKPVTSLLPESTFLYVTWDGIDGHRATWEKTAAYESTVKSGLMSGVYKAIASFIPPDVTPDVESALKLVELIMQRGMSLSVAFGEGVPIPHGVVVLHRSADLETKFTDFVTRIDNDAGKKFDERTVNGREVKVITAPDVTPGLELGWWSEGEHLVIAVGINAVQATLDTAAGKTRNITANPIHAARQKNSPDFELIADAWINFAPLRQRFGEIEIPLSQTNQEPKTTTVNRILEILGLDTLGSAAFRTGFKDRATWSEIAIDAPAPRKGLLAFANQKPMSLSDLPPIPSNCAGFGITSFDLGTAYDTIVNIAKEIGRLENERNVEQIDGAIAQLQQVVGFDVKADLLDPLGHINCFYSDAGQGPLGFGFGVAVSLDDAAKVRTSVNKLLDIAQREAGPDFRVTRNQEDKRELVSLQIGAFVNPAFCVDDKWLAIGLSPQSVKTFLMRLDKKLPTWSPSEEHKTALESVPKEFVSLSVSDPRVTVQSALNMLTTMGPAMLAGIQQQMRASGQPGPQGNPLAEIPPAELVAAPLFPNVSWATVDDRGVHVRERTSLPSMIGVAGVPAAGIGVALLLPAVQQAREAARRAQSSNNLKQIGLAMHNYHDVHLHFPLGSSPNVDLPQEKLQSWLVEILPYVEQSNLYNSIDRTKAWDDAANKAAMQTLVPVYAHPSVPVIQNNGYAISNYIGFAGIGKDGPKLPANSPKAGIFGYNRKTRIADVLDGTSNTAAVTETKTNTGPWGAAGSSTMRPATQKPYVNGPDGFGGITPQGMNVLFADGAVRFISKDIDPKVFEAMITIQGGEAVNLDSNR
ncbi:MAG: DUF1559 domain-containing protein [Planctomycetaceae bacterium]